MSSHRPRRLHVDRTRPSWRTSRQSQPNKLIGRAHRSSNSSNRWPRWSYPPAAIRRLLLADTSTAGRDQLYKVLSGGRAGRARPLRKILDAKAPPAEAEVKQTLPYSGADILGAIRAHPALTRSGELLRPRQDAANLFPEALREGSKATPPYTPFLAPKLGGAPWALRDPARKRASEAGKSRWERTP